MATPVVEAGPSPADDPGGADDTRALPALGLAARTPITSLRWFGRPTPPVALALAQQRFTLGSARSDVTVPPSLSSAVSPRHATLIREHTGLRIEDARTRNGTFRSLGSARLPSFQIEAGDRFYAADVPLLALDAPLEALRPRLAWCLGLDEHRAIDSALELVIDGRPIALVGPTGMGDQRLARAIHAASAQRHNPFVAVSAPPLPAPGEPRGGTVFLALDRLRLVPAPHLRAWCDPANGVRLIVSAPDERRLRSCLDSYRDRVQVVTLVPLVQRIDEIPRLLAMLWRDELRSERSVDDLGLVVEDMTDYRWPRNLDELAEHAPRLLAYLEHDSVRAAALALGIAHQTLSTHFARIGFTPRPADERITGTPLVVVPGKPSQAREPWLWHVLDWGRAAASRDAA